MTCPTCGGPRRETEVRLRWLPLAALYTAAFAVAFVLAGALLHDLVEGGQRSALPLWKLGVTVLGILIALAGYFWRTQRMVCERCRTAEPSWLFAPSRAGASGGEGASRRTALRVLGAGGATVASIGGGVAAAVLHNRGWVPVGKTFFGTEVEETAATARPEWKEARIRNYRRLGRTNAMVSDISLGSGRIRDVEIARLALDRGVTYFDTAPDYAATGSEKILGEAMKGRRDKVFLATKFCVADGHLPNETPVPKIIEAVEASLSRLQTDHVDLIHVHSCDRVERLMAPNIHEAFDRLKEQGKARFLGVSTHTPNLEEVANAAIDSGRFDVMMLAYHFGMWPSFAHILEKAKQHDVGIVAMKTLKGAKHENLAGFRDEASAYSQAAFRWVLSNPNVSCLVISFYDLKHVDEYLYASGQSPRDADLAMLGRYDELVSGDYCQPHCGLCLGSCPETLPINDVLRYRMYFEDYGQEKEGMRLYAALDRKADRCLACPAPCEPTCPVEIPIRSRMLGADRLLRLA